MRLTPRGATPNGLTGTGFPGLRTLHPLSPFPTRLAVSDVGRGVIEQATLDGTYAGSGALLVAATEMYTPRFYCVDVFDSAAGSHYGRMVKPR